MRNQVHPESLVRSSRRWGCTISLKSIHEMRAETEPERGIPTTQLRKGIDGPG